MEQPNSSLEFGKPQRPEEKENGYREAPETIKNIAEQLISNYHSHLKEARILYLIYDDDLKYRGKRVPGRVYKVHDREKSKLKKDFEIVISEPYWEEIQEQGKEEAAMDFLLCFCSIGSSPGSWTTKDPDFYGFYNNIDRYGMWDRSLKNLEKRLQQEKIPFEPNEAVN